VWWTPILAGVLVLGDSYDNARDSSKPIEVYLVRRSQPPERNSNRRRPAIWSGCSG
jgi:hypothetical protein